MAKNSTRFSVSSFSEGVSSDIFQGNQDLNPENTFLAGHDLPSAEAVRNILSFSKALRVQKTRSAGPVETVLN